MSARLAPSWEIQPAALQDCYHSFGGHSLLALVMLSRTDALQELLLILEDHWNRSPDLHGVPIYQASGLASQSLKVYQTYIEMMNDAIKQAFQVEALASSVLPDPKRAAHQRMLSVFLRGALGLEVAGVSKRLESLIPPAAGKSVQI